MADRQLFFSDKARQLHIDKIQEQTNNKITNQFSQWIQNKYPDISLDSSVSESTARQIMVENFKITHPEEYTEYMERASNTVAFLDARKLENVTLASNSSVILQGKESYAHKSPYSPLKPDQLKPVGSLFEQLSLLNGTLNMPTKQTGAQLIKQTTELDQMYYTFSKIKNFTSYASVEKAFNYFNNEAEQLLAYDLETFGGKNEFGYQNLKGITELTFKTFDKTTGSEVNAIENMIGLSEPQYKEVIQMIDNIEARGGFYSNEAEITGSRLAKYGHSATQIEEYKPGRFRVNQWAPEVSTNSYDTKAMREGARRLYEDIGAKQRTLAGNGMLTWEEDLIRGLSMLQKGFKGDGTVSKKLSIVGQNDIKADINWLNQLIAQKHFFSKPAQELLNKKFGGSGGVPYVTIDQTRHVDARTMANFASSVVNRNTYYPDEAQTLLEKYSHFQLEGMGRLRFGNMYNENRAHTASFDVDITAKLFLDPGSYGKKPFEKTLMQQMFDDIQAAKVTGAFSRNLTLTADNYKNYMFMGAQSYSFNNYSRNGALNFVYDHYTKTFRSLNGMEYESDSAKKELFNQYGIKRNAAYSIEHMGKMDLTSKGVDILKEAYPEYAQGSLYSLTLRPIYNPSLGSAMSHHGLQSPLTYIFNNAEEMEGFVSSGLSAVGELAPGADRATAYKTPGAYKLIGEDTNNAYYQAIQKEYGLHSIKANGPNQRIAPTTVQDLIDKSTFKSINDAGARFIREENYSKTSKLYNIFDRIEEMAKKNGYTNPSDIKNFVKNRILAEKIAAGDPIDLLFQEQLGFNTNGNKKIYRETLDRVIAPFDYLTSQRNVFNIVHGQLQEQANNGVNPETIQLMYERSMDNLRAAAFENIEGNPNFKKEVFNNVGDRLFTQLYGHELDYFAFDTSSITKNQSSQKVIQRFIPGQEDNLLRVRLTPGGEYDLINKVMGLYNVQPTTATVRNMDTHKTFALNRFAKDLHFSGKYGDTFKGLSSENYSSANAFALEILERTKNYRREHPGAGFGLPLEVQNVIESGKLFDYMPNEEKMGSIVKDSIMGTSRKNIVSVKDLNQHVEKIVDNILMDVGGESGITKKIDTLYAGDSVRAEGAKRLYSMMRNDQITQFKKFSEALLKTDAQLMYDVQKKTLDVMLNNESISLNSLPTVSFENMNFVARIGNSRIGVNAVLDTSAGSLNETKVRSSLGAAWSHVFNPETAFRQAENHGTSRVLSQAQSIIKEFANYARMNQSISSNNPSEVFKTFGFDFGSGVVQALKRMNDNNELLPALRPEERTVFMDVFKDVLGENSLKTEFVGNARKRGLDATQRETIIKSIPGILNRLAQISNDSDLKFFSRNLDLSGNEKDIAYGVGAIGGHNLNAENMFNNQQRPVGTQALRAMSYRVGDIQKGIEDYGISEKALTKGTMLNTVTSRYLHNRTFDGISGETIDTVRAGRLNISELSFKSLVMNSWNSKGLEGLAKDVNTADWDANWQEKAMDQVINSSSLYNDQAIMDARMARGVFEVADIQKISAKKELIESWQGNLAIIDSMNSREKNIFPFIKLDSDGKVTAIEMPTGVEKKRFDELLNIKGFGDTTQTYYSKADMGMFRFGWFSKGGDIIATGEDIKNSLEGKTFKNKAEVISTLNKMYDGNFYVNRSTTQNFIKMTFGGAEKSMVGYPAFGLGTINARLRNALKEIRKANPGSIDLQGKLLSDDYLDRVLIPKLSTHMKIGRSDVRKMIMDEMLLPSDMLFRGVLKDEGLGPISVITDQGIKDHKNAGYATFSFLDTLKEKSGLSDEVFAKRLNKSGVLGGFNVRIENGKMIVPEIQGPGYMVDINKMKEFASGIDPNAVQDGRLMYGFKHGEEIIGGYSRTALSRTQDHLSGTGSDAEELSSEIQSIQQQLRTGGLAPADERKLRADLKTLQEQREAYNVIGRGAKFTEREYNILKNQNVLDDSFVKTMASNLNENEMNHYLGDAVTLKDGKYTLNEGYAGTSLMDHTLKDIREALITQQGTGTPLTAILEDEKLAKQYGHLVETAGTSTAKNVSLHQADVMHAVSKGFAAQQYNDGVISRSDLITKHGFNELLMEEVVTSRGKDANSILGMKNNIYNNSTLIDFGEALGSDRYLAIPRMPVRKNGEDLVKYEFQKQMNRISAQFTTMHEAFKKYNNPESKDYLTAVQNLKNSIGNIKKTINADITDKNGLLSELMSVRMKNSIMGKSATQTLLYDADGDFNKALNSRSALAKAQFRGMSLLEHAEKGRFVDAKFMSADAFDRLGYFKEDFMRSTLGDKTSDFDSLKDAMKEKLRTTGTMGIDIRYPSIAEGSPKMMMHYLDDSLHQYQMKLAAWSQEAARGDNDGDITVSSMLRGNKDEDYLKYALGKDTANAESVAKYKNAEASIMYRAISVNSVYAERVRQKMIAGQTEAIANSDLFTATSSSSLNNRIYAEFGIMPTTEAVNENSKITRAFRERYGIDEKSKKYLDDVADKINRHITDPVENKKLQDSFAFEMMYGRLDMDLIGKARKLTIGEANKPLYKLRMLSSLAQSGEIGEDILSRDIIQGAAYEIEQEVISAKKGDVRFNVTKVRDFKTAFNSLINGSDKGMRTWLDEHRESLQDKFAKQAEIIKSKTRGNFSGSETEMYEQMRDAFLRSAKGIGNGAASRINSMANIGMSMMGVTGKDVGRFLNNVPEHMDSFLVHGLNTMKGLSLIDMNTLSADDFKTNQTKILSDMHIVDGREWLDEERVSRRTAAEVIGSAGETFANAARSIGGKNLAFGALGLASAFMVAGYVGGNPSKPAETQAADEVENDNSQFYTAPSLQDPNLAQNPTQQGYVININAKSSNNKQQITQAVSNAITSGMPTDINVAMNIKEDPGNISNRYIQQLLAGAI